MNSDEVNQEQIRLYMQGMQDLEDLQMQEEEARSARTRELIQAALLDQGRMVIPQYNERADFFQDVRRMEVLRNAQRAVQDTRRSEAIRNARRAAAVQGSARVIYAYYAQSDHESRDLPEHLRSALRKAWRSEEENVSIDEAETQRRVTAALGAILVHLGLGDVRVDEVGLAPVLQRAERRLLDLKARADRPAEVREVYLDSHPNAHDHHVQFRVLNVDDEVLYSSRWVLQYQSSAEKEATHETLRTLQMGGEDVFLRTYVRCQHLNMTTLVEREDDAADQSSTIGCSHVCSHLYESECGGRCHEVHRGEEGTP